MDQVGELHDRNAMIVDLLAPHMFDRALPQSNPYIRR